VRCDFGCASANGCFAGFDSIKTLMAFGSSAPPANNVLAASCFASRKLQVLWLQLDADDADPPPFFHYRQWLACQLSSRCEKTACA
jgi:hypothetical protein